MLHMDWLCCYRYRIIPAEWLLYLAASVDWCVLSLLMIVVIVDFTVVKDAVYWIGYMCCSCVWDR